MILYQVILEASDDQYIEVEYDWEVSHSYNAEPNNPNTFVGGTESFELKKINLFFLKKPINILPLLSEAAKEEVINLIKQKTE